MKHIQGFNDYLINEDGSFIKRISTGKILKPGFQASKGKCFPDGYFYVTLMQDGMTLPKRMPVHILVAKTYCDNPDMVNCVWVNHEDGNKLNNHFSNLKWGTIAYNINHAIKNGLREIVSGVDHWRTGKTHSNYTKSKMSYQKLGKRHPKFKGYYITPNGKFESSYQAAKALGMNSKTVYNLCKSNSKGFSFVYV
jgi:hypothetical protein